MSVSVRVSERVLTKKLTGMEEKKVRSVRFFSNFALH